MRKAIGLLAVLMCAFSAMSAPPVKVAGMARADFDKLPADTLLDVGGRTLTKTAFLAELGAARTGASPGFAKIGVAKAGAKFVEAEKGRISAQNAAIKAKMHRPGMAEVASPTTLTVKPIITSVEPQVIEPGFGVLVKGIGFGVDAGHVRIEGNFPGGSYTLRTCYQGEICTWYPSQIVGEVNDTSGVQDQNVSLVVVTKSGTSSAPFPVRFRARRVQSCMQVVRPDSVTPGGEGTCSTRLFGDADDRSFGVSCVHAGKFLISAGTDRVSVNLKNGWLLTAYGLWVEPLPDSITVPVVSFTSGSPSMWATMNWVMFPPVTGTVYEDWRMEMCAEGPAGVPFK